MALPKFSLVAQNLGGLQPPSPPGPYAYVRFHEDQVFFGPLNGLYTSTKNFLISDAIL